MKNLMIILFCFVATLFSFSQVTKQQAHKAAQEIYLNLFSFAQDGINKKDVDSICTYLSKNSYKKEVCFLNLTRYSCKNGIDTVSNWVKNDMIELIGKTLTRIHYKWGSDEYGGWMEIIFEYPENTYKLLLIFGFEKNCYRIKSYSPYFTNL